MKQLYRKTVEFSWDSILDLCLHCCTLNWCKSLYILYYFERFHLEKNYKSLQTPSLQETDDFRKLSSKGDVTGNLMSPEICYLTNYVVSTSYSVVSRSHSALSPLFLAVPRVFCPRRLQQSRVNKTACSDAWVSLQQQLKHFHPLLL